MSPTKASGRLPKAQDTANWRKGKDLRKGDKIARYIDGKVAGYETIKSVDRVEYMGGGRNYRVTTTSGYSKTVAGGEFAEGQYGADGDADSEGGWAGAPLEGELSELESKAAWTTWKNLSGLVSEQGGQQASAEGGVFTFRFPNGARASGFYDKLISRYLVAEKPNTTVVRVRRPKPRTSS